MVSEFRLPDVGEGLTEAEIVEWHVAVGDVIKVNDPVCDIETAKSVVELPSPYAGVVQELLVEVGDEVQVGTPIIRIGDSAEASPAPAEASPAPAEGSPVQAEASPAQAEGSPVQAEASPAQAEGSPVQAEASPA
ncbi:MAG: biotin/lipoyl-containing protein, partial [Nocardioides sp.]|uniref:biotin/lipoyl-containing protein n=1 Tax=Nocardioides sp. TaxID=35761 RepID=UPI003D6A295E